MELLKHYFLHILAVAGSVGGLAGYNEGWAYFAKSTDESGAPFSPKLSIELEMGWWSSESTLKSQWIPAHILIQGQTARVWGVITAVALGASALLVAYHLLVNIALLLAYSVPAVFRPTKTSQYQCIGTAALLVLTLSLALYLTLMLAVHAQVKEKMGDIGMEDVWPRPDWAFGCAMLSALSLLLLAVELNSEMRSGPGGGYMPL